MYKIFFILLLIPSIIFAQSHRFIYSYKFVPDSTKLNNTITEETRLEIFKNHSEFLSEITAKRDSAIENSKDNSVFLSPDGNFKNKVYKSRDLSYTIEYIGIQPYKVIQKNDFNWKLLKDKKKILNYNCQKAILNYGNRQWEAWFTEEIPFQEGPYIFKDLPGLIVEIKDTKNQHSFTLVGNYKTDNTKTNIIDKPFLKSLDINQLDFNKKWKIFRKNPIGATEQFMIINPDLLTGQSFSKEGRESDINTIRLEERNKALLLVKENNNFLNLNLYK